jgi:hypothetical protein
MPNAFDNVLSAGYMRRNLMVEAFLSQQVTLGGGDIRRQDMPFVSNRMNYSRAGVMAMLPIPKTGGFEGRVPWRRPLPGATWAVHYAHRRDLVSLQREARSEGVACKPAAGGRRPRALAQPGTVFTDAGLDAGAGNWRMIPHGPTQIAVAAPGQVTSADYQRS